MHLHHHWPLAALFASLATLAACSGASSSDDTVDEEHFTVGVPGDSLLKKIESNHGHVVACLGIMGFGGEQAAATARMKDILQTAATKWNDLLADNHDWSTRSVTFDYVVQVDQRCSVVTGDMRVDVYKSAEQFTAEVCRPGSACSSATAPWSHKIFLGAINRGYPVDPLDPSTTLHEYGHILGLGDTYRTPGMLEWSGEQPASIMNGRSSVLSNDDKLGLWATLRALRTGKKSCDGFGSEVTLTKNAWNDLMCNPDAVAVITDDAPTAPTGCGLIPPNTGLVEGTAFSSCNNRFVLNMQTDGNLVLYRDGNVPIWNTKTAGRPGHAAVMQGDGNFVLYDRTWKPLWASSTQNHPNASLVVQDDGNLVVYGEGNVALWASGTNQ